MAWAGTWVHDSRYGTASVVALPAGQATLARDGADLQARTIAYAASDRATTTVTRAYGPGDRKAIESGNGTTRHHVYGGGPAPILRTEGDGGFTYQVGLDTIVVDASGAATAARRVVDFKRSTVAVLGDQGTQPAQRAAYAPFGSMQLEKSDAGSDADPYSLAALLAAYEGLTVWQLGADQLLDNRARLYAPASARFLALDGGGQALAYEARANNPVTRIDPDGNIDFDQLIAAIKQDSSIAVAFGDEHDKLDMPRALLHVVKRLEQEKIPFRIFQEANVLTRGAAGDRILNKRFQDKGLRDAIFSLLNRNLIFNLDHGHIESAADLARFKARFPASLLQQKNYRLFRAHTEWEQTIPAVFELMKKAKEVPLFIIGAGHLNALQPAHDQRPLYYENYQVKEFDREVVLMALSSFNLQAQYHFITVLPGRLAHLFVQDWTTVSAVDSLPWHSGMTFAAYQVNIPAMAFAKHPVLRQQYKNELDYREFRNFCFVMRHCMPQFPTASVSSVDGMRKEDEKDEEKNGEIRSMKKSGKGFFPGSTFHDK